MNLRSLVQLDARLSQSVRVSEKPGIIRTLSAVLAHSGDSWFWGLGLLLVWLLGETSWKRWAAVEFLGIAGLAALVMLTKFTVRRRRPEGEWGTIYRSADPHSFPSGHAARSFLIAVIATALAPTWLAAILWVWAPLVALARVVMGLHYVSDVAAGIVIGVIAGFIWLAVEQPLAALIAARFQVSPW
jgi:undecaprenyl-diphosphatase